MTAVLPETRLTARRKQAFEKMVSGMYLGEITRNILLHLIDASLLFEGHSSEILNTHYGFDAAFVSKVESACEGDGTDKVVEDAIVHDLGVDKAYVGPEDLKLVRWAVGLVAHRAAALSATAITAIILHTEPNRRPQESVTIDIGADGSVVEFLPNFEGRVRQVLRCVLGDEREKKITIGLAKDGSGVGAALAALTAKKAAARKAAK